MDFDRDAHEFFPVIHKHTLYQSEYYFLIIGITCICNVRLLCLCGCTELPVMNISLPKEVQSQSLSLIVQRPT